ncbi:MAG: hypothetical protein H7X93_05250 [Sphingomonadaceae bacterium]|nr:hypothetical protein [Sphingomonadaceae bacterium]
MTPTQDQPAERESYYRRAKARAEDAYESALDRTTRIYTGARDTAATARRATAEGVQNNPLGAIFGGIALGALIGSLLPRTRRESELVGPYARDLKDRARDAAEAARLAGMEKLDELGFNKDRATETVQQLVSTAKSAATEAGNAAVQTARND